MFNRATISRVLTSLTLILIIASCRGAEEPPAPIAEITQIPAGVEVMDITEDEITTNEITQSKIFDQCESASSFNADIKFGSSSSQEVQKELVIGGNLGVEVGLSEVAKVKIGGAIQNHFLSGAARGEEHIESVSIEVPPYTKQEYIIVWHENRRSGQVEYIENGETKFSDYSYRLGIEFFSSRAVDLKCPETEQKIAAVTTDPTELPTYTPYPTYTPIPTHTTPPEPTPTNTPAPLKPTNTPKPLEPTSPPPEPTAIPAPQNTGLSVGQWYTSGNISIGLTEMKFKTSPITQIGLTVPVRNVSSGPISFEYGSYNFLLKDNNGNTYPAEGSNTNTVTLNAGQTERFLTPGLCCQMFFKVNHADPSITQLTFSVSNLSGVEYAEWTIPVNH